jgi:hypothetical protein
MAGRLFCRPGKRWRSAIEEFEIWDLLVLTDFVVMHEKRERETREISETRKKAISRVSFISRVSRSLPDILIRHNHKNR